MARIFRIWQKPLRTVDIIPNWKKEEKTLLPEDQRKSKITAGVLCFFLFGFGAHEFYLGHFGKAILWIICSGIAVGLSAIFPLFALLILIPLIGSIKLWAMPQSTFDLKYNYKGAPKGGCLVGAVSVIVTIVIIFFLMSIMALPSYHKALDRARTQQSVSIQNR